MAGEPRATLKDTIEVVNEAMGSVQKPRNPPAARKAAPAQAATGAGRPTPGPDALVELLEPLPAKPPATAGLASRKVLIAVLIGVIVLSIAALAGILASRGPRPAPKTAANAATEAPVVAPVKAPPAQVFVVDPLPKTEESHPPAHAAGRRKATARP